MSDRPHLTMVSEGGVDQELDDERLVIRPSMSAAAMRRRLGGEPVIGDEFDRLAVECGVLPADGEG